MELERERSEAVDPTFVEYDEAVKHARRLADIAHVAYTVCAEIGDHKLGFYVLTSERYASLRERGLAHSMAPVASILSNGALNEYHFRRREHV